VIRVRKFSESFSEILRSYFVLKQQRRGHAPSLPLSTTLELPTIMNYEFCIMNYSFLQSNPTQFKNNVISLIAFSLHRNRPSKCDLGYSDNCLKVRIPSTWKMSLNRQPNRSVSMIFVSGVSSENYFIIQCPVFEAPSHLIRPRSFSLFKSL